MASPPKEYFNRTADRALRVLEVLADSRKPVALSEIARLVEASKSSVYPIVRTLVERGYLDDTGGDGYQLTAKTAGLSRPSQDQNRLIASFFELTRTASPPLSETLVLATVSGQSAMVLAERQAETRPVRLSVAVGSRLPLHASASGKVLVAHWSSDAVHITLGSQQLTTWTARTTSNLAALLDELAEVRRQGIAESWGRARSRRRECRRRHTVRARQRHGGRRDGHAHSPGGTRLLERGQGAAEGVGPPTRSRTRMNPVRDDAHYVVEAASLEVSPSSSV